MCEVDAVAKTVPMIGVEVEELCWLRALVSLLRHPDPSVRELTRQALLYLTESASRKGNARRTEGLDYAG
jgi:hypothetical protein